MVKDAGSEIRLFGQEAQPGNPSPQFSLPKMGIMMMLTS